MNNNKFSSVLDHNEIKRAMEHIAIELNKCEVNIGNGFAALLNLVIEIGHELDISKPNLLAIVSNLWEMRESYLEDHPNV